MSEDLLDNFLSLASSSLNTPRQLKETDIFNQENNPTNPTPKKSANVVHTGDTDSSDDEDNKYYQERNYNECGRDIKHILKTTTIPQDEAKPGLSTNWKTKLSGKPQPVAKKTDTDPIFGLGIINPVVSFTTLQDRMVGREAVPFWNIKKFVGGNISDKNWVLAGVIVGKSSVKTSQKGNQFLIWTLSDLKFDLKTVSVFLFGNAYKQLWKTGTGVVVGILNPSVLENKSGSKDEASLSVDNAQKVMILGQSRDLGRCKNTTKSGDKCTAIVNVNQCEFCIYHVKQEYQKCSKRSELQANFSGRGLTALRNKVLGKNEVFYAGKSYTAIPAKRSRKLEERDGSLLQALSGSKGAPKLTSRKPQKKTVLKSAAQVEVTHRQRLKDLALLEKLGDVGAKTPFVASHSSEPTLESSKQLVSDVLTKLRESKANNNDVSKTEIQTKKSVPLKIARDLPLLSGGEKGVIDLDGKITPKQLNRAKLNALKYIQKNGTLKKTDPNSVKKGDSAKRALDPDVQEPSSKKKKLENEFLSDRFKKIMEASSQHSDLLVAHDNEEQEKYFHKLEAKEQMEEKMINTYKVACKAVRCLQCKYTNFSASQLCKDNKHPLRVFDAVKRFFKCGDCGNRIVALEVVPLVSCKNCGSGKWERTGMMKEKTVGVGQVLSIRGGEQKFTNSVVMDANLDLLVPE